MQNIERHSLLEQISFGFKCAKIVCLIGSRQVGKTTLARTLWSQRSDLSKGAYFDLERSSDLNALDNADLVLPSLRGLIIIDEIQRKKELFPYLRYLHDLHLDQQFLLLGSASREVLAQSGESLAGRITYNPSFGLGDREPDRRFL